MKIKIEFQAPNLNLYDDDKNTRETDADRQFCLIYIITKEYSK